jgi:hypothetical protein
MVEKPCRNLGTLQGARQFQNRQAPPLATAKQAALHHDHLTLDTGSTRFDVIADMVFDGALDSSATFVFNTV